MSDVPDGSESSLHELAITQSIVRIAEQHARTHKADRILSVTVVIGELSGVVPESVEFCFEACARGTSLEGARLHIERIPGRAHCGECGRECVADPLVLQCPACGEWALDTIQGRELNLKELEVE